MATSLPILILLLSTSVWGDFGIRHGRSRSHLTRSGHLLVKEEFWLTEASEDLQEPTTEEAIGPFIEDSRHHPKDDAEDLLEPSMPPDPIGQVDIVTRFLRIVESQQQLGENCTAGTGLNLGEGVVDRYAQVNRVILI